MKNYVKRILSVIMTIVILLSIAPMIEFSGLQSPISFNAQAATSPTWKMDSVTEISQTNARIGARADFGKQITCTSGGFYIGTTKDNMHKNANPDTVSIKGTYIDASFLMSKYKETLKANTTYYYKIYVVVNGTTYTSPVNSFKTLAPYDTNWKVNAVSSISKTNAKISGRVDFDKKITCTGGGFYIGTTKDNMHKNAYPDSVNIKASYIEASFLMSKYKETLKENTTYYYKLYVVVDSVTYYSPVKSFKTLASANTPSGNNDIYNLGEETYSFVNFSDKNSSGSCEWEGHCFGMSITSAGYYLGLLNIEGVGGSAANDVYGLSKNSTVKGPICHYQGRQGSVANKAIVAGGRWYKNQSLNVASDWKEVVNYVKNHNYDNKGSLQLSYRHGKYGHAVNFLYYKVVDGQERVYVYDNNYPNQEMYLYKDSNGNIRQAPKCIYGTSATFSCVVLRDVKKYLNNAVEYKKNKTLYADLGAISVEGAEVYRMDSDDGVERVAYEIPDSIDEVKITPLVENAQFTYFDESYSFQTVTENTYGVLTLATMSDLGTDDSEFVIKEKTVTKIEITNLPAKLEYNYDKNGKLDTNGLVITATYSDNTTKIIDNSLVNFTGFDTTSKGTKTVTAIYEGQSATFNVEVKFTFGQWLLYIICFGWIWM